MRFDGTLPKKPWSVFRYGEPVLFAMSVIPKSVGVEIIGRFEKLFSCQLLNHKY